MEAATNPLSLAKLVFSGSKLSTITKTNFEEMSKDLPHNVETMHGPFSRIRRINEEMFSDESDQVFTPSHNADKENKSGGTSKI
jgi:hypothetical protein